MAFTDMEIAETHEAVRRQGDSDNLYKLGLIYSTGQEVDLVQAHMWFNLAASRGSEAAKECRRDIRRHDDARPDRRSAKARARVAFGQTSLIRISDFLWRQLIQGGAGSSR